MILKAFGVSAAAQRPEEADYCLQEAEKSIGECSISRLEELSKLKVPSGGVKSSC